MRWRGITALIAVACALAGGLLLLRAGSGLTVRETTAHATVPLTEVRPAGGGPGSSSRAPGVVVAHGFAGSARLMMPFAATLARRGFVVVLFDFAGHGRNTAPSPAGIAELDAAVRHLRSLPDVDSSRISLIGHSMGASMVSWYAATNPGIAHTVAISIGATDRAPERMLVLVGSLELPGFQNAATSLAAGSGGRRVVTIPATEHISVLFADRTHEEILHWLGSPPGPAPRPWLGLLAGGLLLIAAAIGIYPLTALLPGRHAPAATPPPDSSPSAPPPSAPPPSAPPATEPPATAPPAGLPGAARIPASWPSPAAWALVLPGLAAAGAAVVAVIATSLLPALSVAGYVSVFTALTGVGLLILAGLRKVPLRIGRLSPIGLVLIGYPIIAAAVPIHLGLTHALPAGPRWWLLAATVAAFTLLAFGTVTLTGGRFLPTLGVAAVTSAVLSVAALTGLAPGFLILILPLLVILLGWQAIWISVLARAEAPAWLVALACAVLPAWPTATAMPL